MAALPDMLLVEFYVPLKQAHVALAAASVGLFAARGLGVLGGKAWPLRALWRSASVAIDTLLAAAGGTLWWMLALHPAGRDRWLLVKLVLIVLYIGLGSLALKRAPSRTGKAIAFGAALACIGSVAAIALTRRPFPFAG